MSRKLPLIPTIVVALAAAVMTGLGVWQLQRAEWKDSLLAQYRAAQELPPIAFPRAALTKEPPLFRFATAVCLRPVGHQAVAGRNRSGETGYVHIVDCATGAEGPGLAVAVGWSRDPNARFQWAGGPVSGIIAPDKRMRMRLVAASSPPGLAPAAPPAVEDIPNNHRFYAFQWFAFALIALVIYALALRRKWRDQPDTQRTGNL